MGTLIIRIVEHLRMRRAGTERSTGLRHVIVIEEAHRLLRNRGATAPARTPSSFSPGMLAEIRAYGEGIVVAEQIPTKLVPDVVKNTALKVVHRLPGRDDRQLVGAAMNLDEQQSRQVVSLPPGVAAVFADGMDRPLRVRVPLGEDRERPSCPAPRRRSPAAGRRRAAASAGAAGRARCTSSARPTCSPRRPSGPGCGSGPTPWSSRTSRTARCRRCRRPGRLWAALPARCASACSRRARTERGPPGVVAAHRLRPGETDRAAAEVAPGCWVPAGDRRRAARRRPG